MKMITAHIFFLIGVLLIVVALISLATGADGEASSTIFGYGVGFLIAPLIFGVKRTGRHSK
jgi:hypothetical protein